MTKLIESKYYLCKAYTLYFIYPRSIQNMAGCNISFKKIRNSIIDHHLNPMKLNAWLRTKGVNKKIAVEVSCFYEINLLPWLKA